jgi:hypothetical protein
MNRKAWLKIVSVCILMVFMGLIINYQLKKVKGFQIILMDTKKVALTDNDIIWYNKTGHTVKLTSRGVNKLIELNIPLEGKMFVVEINGEKVYNGSFVNPISSIPPPPSEVIIVNYIQEDGIIRIEKGSNVKGFDPRENERIFEYFLKLNKLFK